ncbi:rod shape-determining protein MreC [Massilia sp. PAMC28688]|uniref:rod shape-determining protein MreC n=1 Tax=Massilia sp. PAMC28688 TaxID=2861283 RepID=UPI001C6281C9|nr:rod shape-determining protein MreC [Massilia sp. PAMC28688]QYF94553.1 rod shape-determining protein MreC [Massilia sp. PAMC28688]
MEYSPPPLFKQGAPARVKVTVFAIISIILLVADTRFQALAMVRQVTGTVLYPFQKAALMPRDAMLGMGTYFSSLSALQKELNDLKAAEVAAAAAMQKATMQAAENAHLRKLMGAREVLPVKTLMSEILYDAHNSSTRKIVLDRGSSDKVVLGLPVIDNAGVVGQITRVFPFTSEVTLLTDREQAVPVQVLRNGLRSVAYGRGSSGMLDLRFVEPNADIVVGDVIITSGLDGVYPAGLAVAKVVKVENSAGRTFGNVVCQPLAGIDRNRQLLILMELPKPAPRPPAETLKPIKKNNLPKMGAIAAEGGVPALLPETSATPATPAVTPPAPPAARPGQAPVPGRATPPAAPRQQTAAPAATVPGGPAR